MSALDPRVEAALTASGVVHVILPCDPALADTAQFCEHYGIPPANAANTIVVAVKTTPRSYVACLVTADARLDVNRKLAALLGTKKLSFATPEETAERTGMLIGGVTLPGLEMPLLIDSRVMTLDYAILGGGNRSSKIRVAPAELLKLPDARVEDIAVVRVSE